jgi:hypothetical protein
MVIVIDYMMTYLELGRKYVEIIWKLFILFLVVGLTKLGASYNNQTG